MYFIKLSEQLAKKLIGDTKEKFLSTNTFSIPGPLIEKKKQKK